MLEADFALSGAVMPADRPRGRRRQRGQVPDRITHLEQRVGTRPDVLNCNTQGRVNSVMACDKAMQRTLPLLTIAGLVSLGSPTQAQTSNQSWKRLYDPQIGVSVAYPAGVFQTYSRVTDRHPGKRFSSSDGQAEFTYYAFENKPPRHTIKLSHRTLVVERRQLIYKRITDKFFVISSVRNKRISYSRCNFGLTMKCIYLEYPASEKRKWDRAVTRIAIHWGDVSSFG